LASAEHGNVGIVGAGVMGFAMANNLRAAGYRMFGYDPAPAAQQRLRDIGGNAVASPREVGEHCPIVLFSLPSSDALAEAVDGEEGIARAAASGAVVLECSTLPLDVKRAAFDVLARSGKIMLDCPVSGTGAQAARKDLVIFGSGDGDAFERSLPVMRAMSRVQRYLGAFGNGSVMKYIANLLVSIHNVAAAEAMVLGMKAGLDPALVYDTLADSAGTSRMFEVRGPLMRDAQYDQATATIRTHLKDVEIINAFANGLRCPTPLFSAAAQAYYARAAQGFEMQDTASVCAVMEGLAGLVRR
jgi:3-hydroxyisobutyrate dehydrogenase-like beta-hydroxyacid dehydrogenase